MAGNAIIGALRVTLGADTAAFETGLKTASSKLTAFGAAAGGAMAAVGAAMVGAAGVIGVSIQRTINDFDTLSKTSQKIGIPVEQLSSLAYAADLSDVSFEQLSKSVGKLSKTMVEAAGKPTSEAANAFKALGVSVTDSAGKLKSSDTVMAEIAGKFEGIKDGAGKTAVAMALFGKAGAELIPLLNGGRDGLQEMNAEAAQFGAIVSTQAAKQAEAFNDNMTRLGYAVKGVVVQTASQLLPTMVNASAAMVDWAKNSGAMETAITVVSSAMKGLVTSGVIVGAVLKTLAEYISTVSTSLGLLISGEFSKAWERIQTGVAGVAETAKASFGVIDGLWRGAVTGAAAAAAGTDAATKAQKDFNFAAMAGKNAVEQFLDQQNKSIIARQSELETDGMAAGAKERLKLATQAYAVAAANGIVPSAMLRAEISETANKAGLLALQLNNLSLIGPGVTGQFGAMWLAIEATNQKLAEGGLKAEENARLVQQSAALTAKFWTDTATSVAGSIGQMGQTFGKESKVMAGIAKAAGIVQATIAMFVAAAEAQKLGFPAGIAAAGVMLAKGAALVASIKSTSIPGFKDGLSMTVPGGMGGGDTKMFQAMVEPGEQIDITPSRGGFAGSTGGQPQVINVEGLGRNSYSRSEVAEIIRAINDAVGDGYNLRVEKFGRGFGG